jgi:excinuclease ABC subunit A
LFGVIYVLDEPSAGLHPADTEALRALDRPAAAGNSLFVVEHELDVVRHADWVVDVGPVPASTAAKSLQRSVIRARRRNEIPNTALLACLR